MQKTLPVLNVLQHKCWIYCSHKSNQIWYLPFSAVFHVASLNETTPPENIHRGQLCTVPWAVNEAPTGGSWFPVCAKLTHHRNPSVHRFVQPLKLSPKKCYDCCIVSSVWAHIAWLFQTLIDTTFKKKRDTSRHKKRTGWTWPGTFLIMLGHRCMSLPSLIGCYS